MCSIGEDDFGDEGALHTMQPDLLPTLEPEEICKKCNIQPVVIKLSFKEGQCRDCFLVYVRHKFRATLGATKAVPRGSNVMLYFDGSSAAVVLLDMINHAMTQEPFKRLHFNPFILFIDESAALQMDRGCHLTRIRHLLQQFSFENCHYSSIGSSCVAKLDESDLAAFEENDQLFIGQLNAIKCLTSKQDLMTKTRNNILCKAAQTLGCQFIFTSETVVDAASTLMTNIALGRGASVAQDVAFADRRSMDVTILRPIRDLNKLEVDTYVKLNKLEVLDDNAYGTSAGDSASIQNLTRKFIHGLQANYTSTISTIFRTGDKIAPKSSETVCKFCHSALDLEGSSTLFAVEYSRCLSASTLQNRETDFNQIEEKATDLLAGSSDGLLKYLCHSCRNIVSDNGQLSCM